MGAQGGRQSSPDAERRRARPCAAARQDVGRVGPEVRPEVVGAGAAGRARCSTPRSSHAAVPPREVRVALGEAELRPASSHAPCGRVNASARNSTSGCRPCTSAMQPLPEGERLGVRVVDAEDAARRGRSSSSSTSRQARPEPCGRRRPARSRSGRCPGTSWAGSRRSAIEPSGRDAGTTPGGPSPTGGRGSTGGRSRGRPPCPGRSASSRRRSKSPSVPSSGVDRRRGRPASTPIAHGLPGSVGARRRGCCPGPCGGSCRSGGSAAGRRRRSPWRRSAGSRLAAPAKPPSLRGNSSYQALAAGPGPGRPTGRRSSCVVRSWASGMPARSSARWSSRAASSLVRSLHVVLQRGVGARRWPASPLVGRRRGEAPRGCRRRRAARRRGRARRPPPAWRCGPASVANRSVHASMTQLVVADLGRGTTVTSNRSLPMGRQRGEVAPWRRPPQHGHRAATTSWPSRNDVGGDGDVLARPSPWAGCPVGVRGRTSAISIRPRATGPCYHAGRRTAVSYDAEAVQRRR